MGCRDVAGALIVANEIQQTVLHANLVVKKLDLSSLEAVKQFADEIKKEESHVDYLINNAGIMMCPKWQTRDGFDMQFGVNHLGHFLLTLLLLDKLKACPTQARVINVSSIAYIAGQIDLDDINLDKNYDPFVSYAQSKLANVLFTRELAKKLEGTNVVTFALHPG
jgi:NAD(P)-dependent dehydrogenase (short-subunit alcohol dehydrogenase family)